MPGVYLEYIKAGKFVVPVELTFQTETVQVQDDIRGLVNTSKWIEKHNWKEIKAMLKPAVEACLKYNETPLDNIPKSHHISYGENVSLGYLIVANKLSTPFLSVLDTKKNCWTDDEDDDDELLGINKEARMEDHGAAFTEFMPTKTAIRVCVVRKSVVSIDDARRIRKELGVRSEEIRNYFPSTSHLPNEPGPSSLALNQFSENNPQDNHQPSNRPGNVGNDQSSDSEAENIPRTFGDPDEIRDAARIYTHVINRDIDSGEDPDDDLSLPDIEPNPPKKKKGARSRKKSASFSPSKSKRLTHNNILAVSQEGQANFSEEDTSYKRGKKSKRKRTVAVVEPMRTLPNGQLSFEHAIGALGSDKRRKARPGTSHGVDKIHSGGGRSKQPPAIDIIAPDDDRLTITNPPEPIPIATPSTSNTTPPIKEAGRNPERRKFKKKKKRTNRNDDDPHKWERLTPSPLFDDDERESSVGGHITTDIESDLEMPTLTKMVDSDEEAQAKEKADVANEAKEDHTPALVRQPNVQSSPDITQVKTKAALKRMPSAEPTFPKKLTIPSTSTSDKESDTVRKTSTPQPESLASLRRESSLKKEEFNNRNSSPETKVRNNNDLGSQQNKEIPKTSTTTTTVTTRPAITSPAFRNQKAMEIMDVAKRLIMNRTGSPDVNKALKRSGSPVVQIKKRAGSPEQSGKVKKAVTASEISEKIKKTVGSADFTAAVKKIIVNSENPDQPRKTIGTANPARKSVKNSDNQDKTRKALVSADIHDKVRKSVRTPEIPDKMRKAPDIDDKMMRKSVVEKVPESQDKSGKPVTPSDNQDNTRKPVGLPDIQERIKNAVRASQITNKGKTPVQNDALKKTTGSVTTSDTVTKALELLQKNSSVMKKKMLKNTTTTVVVRTPTNLIKTLLPQQEKPKMGDAQTQTDDLIIVPQITKRAFSPVGISNKLVKVSKSYDASSEEELCESPSPRSRTPVSVLEISRLSTATPIHHPALGSPNRDFVDDDGLFSFESPTIPVLSASQASISEELTIVLAPNASGSAESSPTEIYQSPSSPQPGCSHWVTTPTRPPSPPKMSLMPPPASRPPRTPRKISFDQRTNERLSGQETVTPAFDLEDSDDTMPVGSEASNVNQNVGQLFHLMNQPHVFKAGIGLIEKMTTNSVPINVVEQKLGLGESRPNETDQFNALVPLGPKPRKRDLSPDICELVPDKRLKQVVAAASRRSRRDSFDEADSEDPTQALVLRRGNDDEASDLEGSGEACLFDYISKSRHNAVNAYEPRGDEFDLSQRSYCMLNVVPHYELKSRLYKIHSKAVRETSVPLISEHFKVITPQLVDIFQGRLSSVRHTIYLRGYEGKRDLRSLMVVLPYTSSQSNAIVQLIRDHIVRGQSARTEYLNYVNYVLMPEALIRIYARINDIPFENAETEMRFGACYEGELSDTLTLPARE